jgi:RsiW-degrading membrane proteinase PrsW (M82 family)
MDITLRLGVFGAEILLTLALITWMRSSSRDPKVPWKFILQILLWGAVTALVAAFIEIRYTFNLQQLAQSRPALVEQHGPWLQILNVSAVALIEELGKYMIGVFTVVNTRHVHKLSDTIIYLIIIGLGFSLVEDVFFLLNPDTIAPYRLISFYVHSGTSAIIGYSLGRFKFGLATYRELAGSVIAAVGLHFAYNLTTNLSDTHLSFDLAVALTIFISLQIFILLRKTLVEEYELERRAKRIKREHTKFLNLEPVAN